MSTPRRQGARPAEVPPRRLSAPTMPERTVVITGAASGIGRATAARLGAAGWRVISIDLRDADMVADLSRPDERARAIAEATALAAESGAPEPPDRAPSRASSPVPVSPARPTGPARCCRRSTSSAPSSCSRACVRCSHPAAPPWPSAPTRPPCNRPFRADLVEACLSRDELASGAPGRRARFARRLPGLQARRGLLGAPAGHRARLGRRRPAARTRWRPA